MTRHIVLGNQSLLVNIDKWFQVRDIYYPYVGLENHVLGHAHKIGIFVDGIFSWINEDDWIKLPAYKNDTLITENKATNKNLGLKLILEENVYCEDNIFLRKITIKNERSYKRNIRLFFNQDFHLYGTGIGDTAVYQMDHNVIIHYKRSRYFLVGALKSDEKNGFASDIEDYAIGESETGYLEGTFRDAEDGVLSRNPVAQGSVDSTVGVSLEVPGNSSNTAYYYMTVGQNFDDVYRLHDYLMDVGAEAILDHSEECQRSWVNHTSTDLSNLDSRLATLYKRSLLIIKTQYDTHGAIIAANDSDNLQFNRDTYSYMWSRDGALVAITLINAGFAEFTKPFFRFCRDVLWWEGCMLHKYNPDKTLGSSWHPWVEDGKPALPIQEDETALVIYALWKYYESTGDLDFIKQLYEPLIKKAVFFMDDYRYPNSLPRESYDLWEERRGIYTFTSATVYAGLASAEKISYLFNDTEICNICRSRYFPLRNAILKELFDRDKEIFIRGLKYQKSNPDQKEIDHTIDSSIYAIFEFGLLSADDEKVKNTMKNIESKLWVNKSGGVARYENDHYHKVSDKSTGNPWIICTLWLAKWYIKKSENFAELDKALNLINWVADCSFETGIMPEQVNPLTRESISVAPLTWSHAEFVDTVTKYIDKTKKLESKT
ncbi:glycoside hydrolase 15-related protein [Methanohalobium evestigatum Z-7303]|uniref:Glycoside hydrolase 15-related protein n=1 Tax=Methanohalobium evestigatum (strain ATCC BAA-1072 / DSM 3721 / NBRC 107634 / OCM 161 / Z-7303) TaxID=644295 RepID=D7E6C5_METEZ|nr:glycoside hydrolase family 15 protein [Methanohalobium evestigatum]ADI73147.1 glycoside hydrolase 15-related protein [Methanohalobium evestigatum Z-7303]